MRERLPGKRPFDVCFSLKDNERRSHRELKHLIQQQTGVHLTRMTYEPLTVPSGGAASRNRWQVTTGSVKDIETLLLKGLQVDDNQIVVMAADEIMEREFNTFWNIEEVHNERRKAWKDKSRKYSAPIRKTIFLK